ncbi:translation protein SH3-like domain-containing protein [Xylariaceae sp. FL0255]|nr:translation protein SH3-like domain-containing protein [Xylariaceae sp. FL0255]
MLTQSARRPLAVCGHAFRRAAQQPQVQILRQLSTEPTTTTSAAEPPAAELDTPSIKTPPKGPAIRAEKPYIYTLQPPNPTLSVRSQFAVWQRIHSHRRSEPRALESYHAQQIARLDPTGMRTALFSRRSDSAKVGDVLQVTTKRGAEPFAGICLQIRRAGVDTAILLRNHVTRVGVELWYKIYSPNITGIEIIHRRQKRARRAKLMYMRQPKHDMGSVERFVEAWKRSRNVFSSKAKTTTGPNKFAPKSKKGGRR